MATHGIDWQHIQFIAFEYGIALSTAQMNAQQRHIEMMLENWPVTSPSIKDAASLLALMHVWQYHQPRMTPRQLIQAALELHQQAPGLRLRQYIQFAPFFQRTFHLHWLAIPTEHASEAMRMTDQLLSQQAAEMYRRWTQRLRLMQLESNDYVAAPIHPLLWQRLRHETPHIVCIPHMQSVQALKQFWQVETISAPKLQFKFKNGCNCSPHITPSQAQLKDLLELSSVPDSGDPSRCSG